MSGINPRALSIRWKFGISFLTIDASLLTLADWLVAGVLPLQNVPILKGF
jgi:hypothetical protein